MSLEGPITSGFITRRPFEETGLAAMGLLMSISIFIESPVIDLLSTSTTLTKTHASYLQLRRFTLLLMVWVASVHALITLTPFYWTLVERVIGAPHDVAVALRPAMVIMIPWAALVGWRRFHHGILIRYDRTRPVGLGTTVRVTAVFVIGATLYALTDLPGITLAAFALLGSVAAETVFIHFVTRPVVRWHLDPMVGTDRDTGITMNRLCRFHFPLTAATLTMIFSMPMVSWALAHSPDSKRSLAAWGLCMSVAFMFRAVTFALPETVIALYKDEHSRRELQKFCIRVGVACSLAIGVMYLSGGAQFLFQRVLDSKPGVASAASLALVLTLLIPAINGRASMFRGLLTAHHRTQPRLWAISVAIAVLAGTLILGVWRQADGILVAGLAMTLQVVAELLVLGWFWGRTIPNMDDVL